MKRHHNGGVRKVCGCARRGWAKCPHPWHFSFKWAGTHHRFSLDKQLGRHIESKSEAEDEAGELRKQIKAGKFGQPAAREDLTLRQLADTYVERYVLLKHAATEGAFRLALNTICRQEVPRPGGGAAPLGEWRVADIVTDTVMRFAELRRAAGASVGVNRLLGSLRAMYNWAREAGYIEATPFERAGRPAARGVFDRGAERKRDRRLRDEEERKLRAAANPHLQAVITAAIETGMRRAELLGLRWNQIEGMRVDLDEEKKIKIEWAPRAEIALRAAQTKTKRDRRIPISSRLRAVLEMRRCDPVGQPLALDAFVFGTEIGTRIADVGRAWDAAVLRSHGVKLAFTATANLTPECRKALGEIDLHFHDLRREAGSRWLEGGVPLHVVRDWLGHSTIAQTSTYLSTTTKTQHDAMRAFEERVGALQPPATDAESGGQKPLLSAKPEIENAKEIAIRHDPRIM